MLQMSRVPLRFSGVDWGRTFVGITKKTWVNAYLMMMTKPLTASRTLARSLAIPPELINCELPSTLQSEHFACHVYSSKGPTTLGLLRWELFLSNNLEGEMLPPTRAALLPHYLRANSVTMQDKSYLTNFPVLPPIEENRWNSESGGYIPGFGFLALPAPKAVLELIKYGSKAGCKGRCSCSNNLPFTPW